MAQKKAVKKTRSSSNGNSGKVPGDKGAGKVTASASRRNGSKATANDLTLIAWKHTYAKRDRFGKFN